MSILKITLRIFSYINGHLFLACLSGLTEIKEETKTS